jgi:RNA polymerase sigma-70 factor (ECF subfamily)
MRDPHELQRHAPQLRELAQRLIGDEHLADDLVQETYVRALQSSDEPKQPRRWLRETLRLRARHLRSSEESRARREREAAVKARSEASGSSEELSAVRRALREELDLLEEPYRATLFARFVEGEPPRAIAARSGLSVRTVNTRVTRGIRKLRQRLDRRLGAGWLPLLALGLLNARHRSRLPGARLVGTVLASLGATALIISWLAQPEPTQIASALEPTFLTRTSGESSSPTIDRETRGAVPVPQAQGPTPSAIAFYRGVVTDLEGAPVAGLTVALDTGECVHEERSLDRFAFKLHESGVARTTSDEDGVWRLPSEGGEHGRIVAYGNGYRAVIGELVPGPGEEERSLVLVSAPERPIMGIVHDSEGRPIEGATITATPSASYLAGLTRRTRTWAPLRPTTTSAEDGTFELASYDVLDGRVDFDKGGFLTRARIVPSGPVDLRVELVRTPATVVELHGFVVDEHGDPLEGAMVVAGSASGRSGVDGSVRLGPGGLSGARVLWAVAPDRCPARVELSIDARGAIEAPVDLTLRLGEPSLTIEGTAIDSDGAPLAGAIVWCADATHMGGVRSTYFVERYMFADGDWGMPFTTNADDHGRFRIPYLADREYRIGALELSSLASTVSAPVPSGTTDLVLHLPTREPRSPVAGLVLARDGQPLSGVRVTIKRTTIDVKIGAGGNLCAALALGSVETDADGWFVFDPLPLQGLHLALEGDGVLPDVLEIPTEGSRERLEVVLARRSRVHVKVVTDRRVDHVALVDGRGIKLPLHDASNYANNSEWGVRSDIALNGRPSVLIIAPDTAVSLVAYGNGAIVEQIPVVLSPKSTLEIDL